MTELRAVLLLKYLSYSSKCEKSGGEMVGVGVEVVAIHDGIRGYSSLRGVVAVFEWEQVGFMRMMRLISFVTFDDANP